MRRKWFRGLAWVLLTPIVLFVILMALLYVPPVQNFLRRQVTTVASEATGMNISVERIDLRFPLNLLVRGVVVVQQPDTLLNLESLNVSVQALPLLQGKVEVDDVTLKNVALNSADLVEGMKLEGTLGEFYLESHCVDLNKENVILNRVGLNDTHMRVVLADTTTSVPDTTTTVLNWKIALHTLALKNVSVDLKMPLDTMSVTAHIGESKIEDADVDLGREYYGWRRFTLTGTSVNYDTGTSPSTGGFDASHIALRNINVGIDSVMTCGRDMNAVIREFSLNERSGLSVTSLTGRLFSDTTLIRVPYLKLNTPHSQIDLTAQTYWELVDIPTTGRLTARFNARIGKQDVMLFADGLPETFKEAYPFHPLVIHAGTEGNLTQMQLSRFTADLPGAFSLSGAGEMWNLTDSLKRNGKLDFEMQTQDLNFLTGLTGVTPDGSIVVPDSMNLLAGLRLEGSQCDAILKIREGAGSLDLNAAYNLSTDAYHADLAIDSLQIHNFLPKDSIYTLSANLTAHGQGTDITSANTFADLKLHLKELEYARWNVSAVDLQAGLKSSVASVQLASANDLLKMKLAADLRLDREYLDGKADIDVENLNMYELGLAPGPLKHPFTFRLQAEARHDSIKLLANAGDLDFRFRAHSTLKRLLEQSEEFTTVLMQQIEDRHLDHAALRRVLPAAGMHLWAGKENPISYFLAANHVSYDKLRVSFGFTPKIGINGRSTIYGLRTDSLQLDTIFFSIKQDTTRMMLQGGVINGPKNPQFVFRTTLTGEIRNEDAGLTLNYVDGKGETGVLLGLNARPLTEGHGRGNGLLFNVTPAEPIIAYRKFRFADKSNWIYLHKNMRVYANIDMNSDDGLCFRMQSDRHDTLSLQNMNVELSRFQLGQLSDVLPYLPRISGLFSAEAHYIQTPTSLQVSAEANIDDLTYERQPVGDVGLGATWLPSDGGTDYLSTYFSYDNQEVLTADGSFSQKNGKGILDVNTTFQKFPMKIANAFVPDQMVSLTGVMNGDLAVQGTLDKPDIQGSFTLDSVSVYARQAGARYWFDNRPIRLDDNQLTFDKFAIYTTSDNPFTIDGKIDFRNFDRPTADLRLNAENYTLLDAARTRESLIYGKVVVDLRAMLRGPLEALTMRGDMNLLGSTDVTYVLTDSPLTVEDRLDGLVTFTSFADTASVATDGATMTLGGMNMVMSLHIDDAVRLRADLSTDRSKYIELEGGGDLNLQYSPQGDISLMGRYTLTGGVMKYSLPVIPLKDFQITSGSYVDWRGDPMNPTLNLTATERVRASVSDDDSGSRTVNFDVSISIKNRLDAPELVFDIAAPEDATVQNELQAMGAEERSKQAIAMLATGVYMNSGVKGGGLTMGSALNSVIQSQINALAGSAFQSINASFSMGMEDATSSETGDKQTNYSFRYSQRLFNDRVQFVIGGKVTTGANATNNAESFIDNISLEYRLDTSGTRNVRVFYKKNNESVLDGEITETGVGLVLRRKMDKLSELFIFKKKKKQTK